MKYLHNNQELFNDTIVNASEYLNIEPAIIEKDYYVTLFLKKITAINHSIILRGGTSLSKCFNTIQRFSEDIDIGINADKATESMKKRLKKDIVEAINELGFELNKKDLILSRCDFNRYQIKYTMTQNNAFIKPFLLVETAVFIKPYPYEAREADSYIYRFLKSNGFNQMINVYELNPFDVNVQTMERTFIDKLFAIGDYYLADKDSGHSRHLYDLLKIRPKIVFDERFYSLLEEVRAVRAMDKHCISAKPGINLGELLSEMCSNDFYKNDYKKVTEDLLFKLVSYEETKTNLMEIADKIKNKEC